MHPIRCSLAAGLAAALTAGALVACGTGDPAEFEPQDAERDELEQDADDPGEAGQDDAGEGARDDEAGENDEASDATDDSDDWPGPEGAIASTTLPIINEGRGGQLEVAVHHLTVDGDFMEMELSFTPEFEGDAITTHAMMGHFFRPGLNDRENLKRYTVVDGWMSGSGAAGTRLESGQSIFRWYYFAAPEDDIDSINVTVIAGAAEIGNVPITAGTIPAADRGRWSPPDPPESGIAESERRGSVIPFGLDGAIERIGEEPQDEGDGVDDEGELTITLSSDVLFAENSWELSAGTSSRIAELVADIPDGATVQVVGHTDSQDPVGQDFDNQELSENRADAVADALRSERPDLDLEVSGVGDSDPAVAERENDPDTYAANRRVDISYEGRSS